MPEDFALEHQEVLDTAQVIFEQKSRVRGQMWLDFPPSDKIRELRERVMRLKNAYELREEAMPPSPGPEAPHVQFEEIIVEDALDIINYAAFLIKQIRRGARG